MDAPRQLGLETQRQELQDVPLEVTHSFPDWLEGTFVSNGPGQFEVGDTALDHWFDTLAMLRLLRFEDGEVRYTNRFVRSKDFDIAHDEGRIRRSLPGTPADGSLATRVYRALTGAFQDNPSIGVVRLDGSLYAVTESPVGIEIDPKRSRQSGGGTSPRGSTPTSRLDTRTSRTERSGGSAQRSAANRRTHSFAARTAPTQRPSVASCSTLTRRTSTRSR